MITVITSRANPLIQQYAALKNSQERYGQSLFVAEGMRACTTLFESGVILRNILYTAEHEAQIVKLFPIDHCIRITSQILEKLATTDNPSGIIGVFQISDEPDPSVITPGVVLVDIANPGNMGTLIRTAAALGVSSVVVVEGSDPWSPKVIQATAGTIGNVKLFQWSWSELVMYAVAHEIPLAAMVVSGGNDIRNVSINKHLLVIGSEAHGLPLAFQKQCQELVTLPMHGNVESLNAAISGSIALYLGYGLLDK